MNDYFYKTSRGEFRLKILPSEAHMLVHLELLPSGEKIFGVHKTGVIRSLDRADLLRKARLLEAGLSADGDLLCYSYGIKELDSDGQLLSSGGGGFTCAYEGASAIAEAGPGFCHIVGSRTTRVRGITKVEHCRLRDLRDMKPVTLDDGRVAKPQRRHKPTDLARRIAELVEHLKESKDKEVSHWFD